MTDLIIYGASDDLIEVEGVVRDEFYPPYDKPAVLTVKVDDATHAMVRVEYDDTGTWRLRTSAPGATFISARGDHAADDADGCPGYSDKVILDMTGIEARRIALSVDEAV